MPKRFIYVIGTGEAECPVKIGVAGNVSRRLGHMRAGSPVRLRELFSMEVEGGLALKVEAACHRELRKHVLAGEWFSVNSSVASDVIRSVIARSVGNIPVAVRPPAAVAFRASRKQLGFTAAELAHELRMGSIGGERTVRRWETGESRISGPAQVAVELLLEKKHLQSLPVDGRGRR